MKPLVDANYWQITSSSLFLVLFMLRMINLYPHNHIVSACQENCCVFNLSNVSQGTCALINKTLVNCTGTKENT